jgi:hypothetical protein
MRGQSPVNGSDNDLIMLGMDTGCIPNDIPNDIPTTKRDQGIAMRRHTNQSYLIRLWRDRADRPLRVTLTPVATPHVRRQFANLDELQSFLITQTSLIRPIESEEVQHTQTGDDSYCTSDQA